MPVNRSAALVFIFITVLIDVIGLGIIIPVIPKLIEELIGSNTSDAARYGGWLVVAYAGMQFIFAPILGGISDKAGRRPVLLISLFGLGIDYIIHAIAPTIGILFAGRLLAGIAGASFTTANAYIADISTPEKRSQNFGLVGAAFGLGFIIGPVIGGLLSEFGLRVPFLVAAGLSFLNVLYGYFVLPESLSVNNRRTFSWKRANPVGSLKHLQKYPVISGLIITFVLLHLAAHAVQSTWTYYTMYKFDWDIKLVGLSLGFVGLLIILVQGGLIRIVIPRFGQKNAAYIGMSLWWLGLVLFAFAYKSWMMYAFLIPYALGGIAGPAIQGILSNQVPISEQGELQGALTSLMSIAAIIGPLIMTQLFYRFTNSDSNLIFPGAPFIAGAVFVALGILSSIPALQKLGSNS
jgi:DHA1 family tetracycline resistance protein-like MFS transporter